MFARCYLPKEYKPFLYEKSTNYLIPMKHPPVVQNQISALYNNQYFKKDKISQKSINLQKNQRPTWIISDAMTNS